MRWIKANLFPSRRAGLSYFTRKMPTIVKILLICFHPGERDYVIPTIVEYEHKKDIEGFHPGEQDYVIPPFFAVLCIAIAFSVSIPASGIM